MRCAVFSDVHGNLEALQAVLEKIALLSPDRILCLGDVVGYGADPNGCVQAVQKHADAVLAGNHDWAALGLEDTCRFNPAARVAAQWTREELGTDEALFLRMCPLVLEEGDVSLAHASPLNPSQWDYIPSPAWGRAALAESSCRLCFVGHSHRGFICAETGQQDRLSEGSVWLAQNMRYLVNVGSVGQPRDGDPRASFALWDQESGNIALHRVSYDIATAQNKIRSKGLPDYLADRLAIGQ
ncbi:MAG: metallophosphoesterase family protein [bacterium]|nr:metallophosphoesterase family protein [bacterium]